MFVPAKEVYVNPYEVKPGDKLNVSSGMGGSFSVEVSKVEDGLISFNVTSPGWEAEWSIMAEDAGNYFFNLEVDEEIFI